MEQVCWGRRLRLGRYDEAGSLQEENEERMGGPRQKRRDKALLLTQEHHVRKQSGVQKPGASGWAGCGRAAGLGGKGLLHAASFPTQGLLWAVEGPNKIICHTVYS